MAVEKNVGGSRPKELYEDIIEEVDAHFTRDRSAIKDGLKDAGAEISADWTLDDFVAALDSASVNIADVMDVNRCYLALSAASLWKSRPVALQSHQQAMQKQALLIADRNRSVS